MYPKSVKNLIECLKDLPGVGEKSAERLAFSMINFEKEKLQMFSDVLLDVKNNIHRCLACNNISEGSKCIICSDESRNDSIIFVVEKPKDIILFEKLNNYNGTYHVLDGLISPLDGIDPSDINISNLIKRVEGGNVKEIIFALKPSVEGETTMQYIKKVLEKFNVKFSKIATGIPIGTDIEYLDSLTLEMAFEERKNLS